MRPEPLRTEEEIANLYEGSINSARGEDLTSNIANRLEEQHGQEWYKLFFYGSRGSGKSTEMSRLFEKVAHLYRPVRIDVRREMNPVAFQPHEILLTVAIAIVRETVKVMEATESQAPFDAAVLYAIDDWFAQTEYTEKRTLDRTVTGIVEGKALIHLLGQFNVLGATITGTLKSNFATEETTRFKRRAHYAALIENVNRLVAECDELLGASTGTRMEWLISIEDFDKNTPLSVLNDLVHDYAHIFTDLQANFICNLPLGVLSGHNLDEGGVPFRIMYDTPVYTAERTPDEKGRASLRRALARRMNLGLFADDGAERLIVASGGGLRSLFSMASRAADAAALRCQSLGLEDPDAGPIVAADVAVAINAERQSFRQVLGVVLTEEDPIPTAEKLERLRQVYDRADGYQIPDPVLNELLIRRAVQSFNGIGRLAVHPVVVDLMCDDHAFGEGDERKPGGLL